jgi:hypothetical protein
MKELTEFEMKNLNGGWLGVALAIIGAVIYLYNNKEDFVEGFKEGYQYSKENHSVL